jgi:protein-tyrosine phosphatase
MRSLVREAGLEDEIFVDSAGMGDWHLGDAPDRRSTAAAQRRGIVLEGASRQITASDFEDFDLLLAMDSKNLREMREIAPPGTESKIRMLRSYDPASSGDLDVPDPYYGEGDGFETVLDQVDAACRALLDELRG